jgi:hypothetical protein
MMPEYCEHCGCLRVDHFLNQDHEDRLGRLPSCGDCADCFVDPGDWLPAPSPLQAGLDVALAMKGEGA